MNWKDVEGSDFEKLLIYEFPIETEENHEKTQVKIACFQAEIWTASSEIRSRIATQSAVEITDEGNIIITHGAGPFLKSRQLCSYSRNSQHSMELEGSLPCSQEPSTDPYPEPDQSNSCHPILSL
jgi:hypothetical protein